MCVRIIDDNIEILFTVEYGHCDEYPGKNFSVM